jgi:hypothetical protein
MAILLLPERGVLRVPVPPPQSRSLQQTKEDKLRAHSRRNDAISLAIGISPAEGSSSH